MKPQNDFFGALARAVVREGVQIGKRAATSAVKSVMKDSGKIAEQFEKYAKFVQENCDEIIEDSKKETQ